MVQPKISVITVTYNSEKTLERTILSVIEQTYSELQYVIVDGGSTDDTLDIIRKYEERIDRWISEPDRGISDAFNKGIAMASGDIIGIINSDDGLLPGALQAVASAYRADIDVYRGDLQLRKEDTGTTTVEKPSMHLRYDGLNAINHPSTFIAKRAYERYGCYDPDCRFVMDYDLLMRFERAGAKFEYIAKPLAFFTMNGITFSEFTPERRNELRRILRRNGANYWQVESYFLVKYIKMLLIRIFGKDVFMHLLDKKQ